MSRARHKMGCKFGGAVGNKNVIREAEDEKDGGEMKRGGRAKKHMKAEGEKAKGRLDKYKRGGRAMGGRTGADKHPLSSAAKLHDSKSPENPD